MIMSERLQETRYIKGYFDEKCKICVQERERDEKRELLLKKIRLEEVVIDSFMLRVKNPTFTSLSTEIREDETLIQTLKICDVFKKRFPLGFLVVSGGYCSYLEGLTKEFNDIDLFMLLPKAEMMHTFSLINILTEIFDRESLTVYPRRRCPRNPRKPLYIEYFSVKKRNGGTTLYNLIVRTKSVAVEDWFSAAKSITHNFDMDICASVLTCDGEGILRFARPEVKIRNGMKNDAFRMRRNEDRMKKYRSRQIKFGNPESLFILAWLNLQV